jgi:hypothetical protein
MKFSEIEKELLNVANGWNSLKDDKIKVNNYVPIGQKYGVADNVCDGVIKMSNGYATIDRFNYEVKLYGLLVALYTDIEIDSDDFTNLHCDVLISNKFMPWLYKVTNNDAFEFTQVYKTAVIDKVRELNASTPEMDLDKLQKSIEEFKKINPDILKLIDVDGSAIQKIARKMVENDTSNKSTTTNLNN